MGKQPNQDIQKLTGAKNIDDDYVSAPLRGGQFSWINNPNDDLQSHEVHMRKSGSLCVLRTNFSAKK